MNKKSNKKLMAGLIALITLIIIGITCSGFLNNFKEGIKFLGISFGISAGLVLLLFIMKYIIKGADKLVGEGRTFNDRAIVLFSILILVSLTCRGFLKNFTLGIVFLIVSIAFVAITFLIMYGINSKKGAIKKAILAEKTSGEKMFILLTVLILVSLTCGGFIQNLKAGILFLIISIISSLALYLTVTEVKNENSIISKIIRIETTFNQKMMILLSTIIMVSLTCGGFLRNLRAGIVFLMISIIFTTSMLMLVLGIKSKHKIYDKIAGFETNFNEKMIILLTTMAMVSITSGGFLYNFKLGMLFLTISLIFSGLVLAGVISVRPRVNIFKMRARIQNLGKREAIRAFGMIFACVFVTYTLSGTWAYFTIADADNNEATITASINKLVVEYGEDSGSLKVGNITFTPSSPQKVNSKISIAVGEPTGGTRPYIYSIKISSLTNISGYPIEVNSSAMDWTPDKAGVYDIKVTITDSLGNSTSKTVQYTIEEEENTTLTIVINSDTLKDKNGAISSLWWTNIYCWGGDTTKRISTESSAFTWPGKALSTGQKTITINGFTGEGRQIILNGNGKQTGDITIPDGATKVQINSDSSVLKIE